MTAPEQPTRTCNGFTEGWCARIGLVKAFEAHEALTSHNDGLAPYHPHQELRDAAAELIGRGGCAEFAAAITEPEPFIAPPEED